jgi:uncharacterized membrane protein
VREVGSEGEKQAIPTDDKGHAEVELPPGRYEAEVRSYGYAKQKRKFKVEDGSVNVLNVELRKKK